MEKSPAKLLPAWFVDRMMSDNWYFGLLTNAGVIICIHAIHSVHQAEDGSIWIDVELMSQPPINMPGMNTLCAPTERTSASINTSHIVAAFELADT